MVENWPANAGDVRDADSIPGLGRSPGEGNGNPLNYSCLENSMDRGAWQAIVHGTAKNGHGSQRIGHDLETNIFTFHFHYIPPSPPPPRIKL